MGLPDLFARWFESRGWAPRRHQLELAKLAAEGRTADDAGGGTAFDDAGRLFGDEGGRGEASVRLHQLQRRIDAEGA